MKKFFFLLLILCSFVFGFTNTHAATMTQSEVDTLMIGATVEGSTGAEVTLLVYSDMECPFCIRLHNDIGLWKNIQAKYGTRVNYVYKNNRGVNHTHTEKKALTALCVKKLSGDAAYIRFYHQVLEGSIDGVLYPISKIASFIRKEKISLLRYNRCMKDPATLAQFDKETQEAEKYNLQGTPGVIILNHKTLKYDTVEGAYPIETFNEKIDALLK